MMNPAALFAPPPAQHGSMTEKLREGLNYSLRTPSILLILIVVAAIGTFGYNFSVVLPLLADKVLHTDAFGFGLLSSCLGLGSLVGAIQSAYVTNITIRRLLIGSGAFSLFFAAIAVSTNFYLTAILLAALGLAGITFSTSSNTLLQLRSPDALRGRIMSLMVLLFIGSTPVGGFLVGTLSEPNVLGVRGALLICAILCGLGVVTAWWYQQRMSNMPEKPKNSEQT
jgi:MFS family permease